MGMQHPETKIPIVSESLLSQWGSLGVFSEPRTRGRVFEPRISRFVGGSKTWPQPTNRNIIQPCRVSCPTVELSYLYSLSIVRPTKEQLRV